ncbi:MAG: DNA polymerase III subunit delta [Verrucomicrobiota bacterium]
MPSEPQIFAFFGSDEAQVKEAALTLSRKLVPADDEFGLEVVQGGADNADHASQIVGRTIEALQTMPFFGGDKTVWLQGANFLGDSVTGKAQATLGAVETLLEILKAGLPSDVRFILSATEVDKRRKFYKEIDKLGKVAVHDKVDTSKTGWETQVMAQVADRAKPLGLTFADNALERFVLLVGADTRLLQSELEKLSLFVGERPATEKDVGEIIAASHVGVIFEIGDALARRNLPKCLELIDAQLRRGESAVGILLAAIVPKVRGLLHARDLIERHGLSVGRNFKSFESAVTRLPPAETSHLPRKKDGNLSVYPIFLAGQVSDRFSASELKNALEACLDANRKLVTSSLDHRLVLNQLVTRILSP